MIERPIQVTVGADGDPVRFWYWPKGLSGSKHKEAERYVIENGGWVHDDLGGLWSCPKELPRLEKYRIEKPEDAADKDELPESFGNTATA